MKRELAARGAELMDSVSADLCVCVCVFPR